MSEQTAPTLSSSVQTMLDKLTSLKREAYSHLDQALTFDTNTSSASTDTKIDTAIIMYERCLRYIDEAVAFYQKNRAEFSHHDDAIRVYNQLINMRNQTNDRIGALKDERLKMANGVKTPIDLDGFLDLGEEILNDNDCVIIDDDIGSEGANKSATSERVRSKLNNLKKASEILRVDNGVQIFYISDDGAVSTPSYPTTLSIYSFDDEKQTSQDKKVVGFIRVGSWMYPLVPNESPAMKTTFNAYIFPNGEEGPQDASRCSFVGITFADGITDEHKSFFEDVLVNYDLLIYQNKEGGATSVKPPVLTDSLTPIDNKIGEKIKEEEEVTEPAPKTSSEGWTADRVAHGLVTSATFVSQGISTGTEYASKYIKTGAEKIKSQLQPNSQPTQVDPKYQHLVQNVRYGTHVGVRVSSYLVNKLGQLASYTARTVGPHIRNGSTALLTKSGVVKNENSASGYVEGVCKVAHGSLESYGILYDSLEKAAKSLGKNFVENTVEVVEHKYGPSAAQTTKDGMYSVGNVAISVNNVQNFKIVRTLAKATAKEVIKPSASKSNIDKDANQDKKTV